MAQVEATALFSDGNLEEYWKLESVSANKNGNNLTNTGSVAFSAARWALGADFGTTWGVNGKALRNTGLSVNLAGAWSVSFWIKERVTIIGTGIAAHVIDWTSTTSTNTRVIIKYQDNAGTPRIVVEAAGTATNYNHTIGTSAFEHIVVTSTGNSGTVTIYVNGTSVATGSQGTGTNAANSFSIGAAYDGTSNGVAAIIDDVAVFDRVLNSGEVSTLYNGGALTYSVTETTTLNETSPSYIRGALYSVTEIVTPTETLTTAIPRVRWSNATQSSSSWTNQSKP